MAAARIDYHHSDNFILFDTTTQRYYSLDMLGAMVWNLMQRPMSIREIREAIADRFDLEPEIADTELRMLLEEMQSNGLIEPAGS